MSETTPSQAEGEHEEPETPRGADGSEREEVRQPPRTTPSQAEGEAEDTEA